MRERTQLHTVHCIDELFHAFLAQRRAPVAFMFETTADNEGGGGGVVGDVRRRDAGADECRQGCGVEDTCLNKQCIE